MVLGGGGIGTIRVEPEKPILFLLIGTDIDQSCCPFCAIDVLEFFQKDLNLLSVWCVLGDQMKAFSFFDRCRRFISVERVRHCLGMVIWQQWVLAVKGLV